MEIPRFIQTIPAQIGVDPGLGDLLGRDADHILLRLLIPEDVGQGLKLRCLIHVAAKKAMIWLSREAGIRGRAGVNPALMRENSTTLSLGVTNSPSSVLRSS